MTENSEEEENIDRNHNKLEEYEYGEENDEGWDLDEFTVRGR